MRLALRAAFFLLPLTSMGSAAHAHIIASRLGDFYTGVLHPMTDLLDIITWLCLGVLAGACGGLERRWLVLVFPLGLGVGLATGMALKSLNYATGSAAAVTVLGLMLVAHWRIAGATLAGLAFSLAILRGAANAGGLGPESNWLLYAAGLCICGYVVVTMTMALTCTFLDNQVDTAVGWRTIAVRAVGSWVAAVGLLVCGLTITR